MIEARSDTRYSGATERRIEFSDNAFTVDAELIGELLRVPTSRVQSLMREGEITSACERGIDEHEGEFRLTFFHGNRRARLSADQSGRIIRRSVVNFDDQPDSDAPRSGTG